MPELLIILFASCVFGGLWWLLSKIGANPFVVAAVSMFGALLVFVSRTLFGIPL